MENMKKWLDIGAKVEQEWNDAHPELPVRVVVQEMMFHDQTGLAVSLLYDGDKKISLWGGDEPSEATLSAVAGGTDKLWKYYMCDFDVDGMVHGDYACGHGIETFLYYPENSALMQWRQKAEDERMFRDAQASYNALERAGYDWPEHLYSDFAWRSSITYNVAQGNWPEEVGQMQPRDFVEWFRKNHWDEFWKLHEELKVNTREIVLMYLLKYGTI